MGPFQKPPLLKDDQILADGDNSCIEQFRQFPGDEAIFFLQPGKDFLQPLLLKNDFMLFVRIIHGLLIQHPAVKIILKEIKTNQRKVKVSNIPIPLHGCLGVFDQPGLL
jgi:hypothetical protein